MLIIKGNPKKVWFRVPGAGSTSLRKVLEKKYPGGFESAGNDHEMLSNAISRGAWDEFKTREVIVNIRNPYDWVLSMYCMCYRASSHWSEWVLPKNLKDFTKYKEDPTFFLEHLSTPLDWVTHPDTGEMIECTVLCVEKECPPDDRSNPTKFDSRRDFEITPDLDAIIRRRFHRELAHYDQ